MDQSYSSLQVPDNDWSQPGPSSSRSQRGPSTALSPVTTSQSAARKRVSHSITASYKDNKEEIPPYRDVYAHPAALAFTAAHPRRTIPKFGPYLLLQTLGEGEFGKVKLGLHGQWGEEVAVKLIRRGTVDNSLRLSKVEREIEVLKLLKHPNIVRLYDVIETDKYIGIILEYASGGELFDHILAHRCLKEKDACKLFAQLISGVSYIHAKKIVHRDLKLENLLLDRSRNVIITDFGFANRFEHRPDDLMQTSCGSPCYAAPELVISEGLYVGSAVDIWSCGVILYAMLAGYLPFDDDPANPEGDNINLLYKYIVNTPLTFPDHVSVEARDLLSLMLVPDPKKRAGLPEIMVHPWLAQYAYLFEQSVADMEKVATEQQNLKRQAYQRQMRAHAEQQRANQSQTQYIYDSSAAPATSAATPRRAIASAVVMGSSAEPEPFIDAPSPAPIPAESTHRTASKEGWRTKYSGSKTPSKSPQKENEKEPESKRKKNPYRHTVQLEYPEDSPQFQLPQQPVEVDDSEVLSPTTPTQRDRQPQDSASISQTPKSYFQSTLEALFTPPQQPTPVKPSEPGSGARPQHGGSVNSRRADVASINGSTRSGASRNNRKLSIDKFGFGKILGSSSVTDAEPANDNATSVTSTGVAAVEDDGAKVAEEREKIDEKAADADGKKKSRRTTLSMMVEPISRTIKDRTSKNRSVTIESKKNNKKDKEREGSVQEVEINHVSPIPNALLTAPAGGFNVNAQSPAPPTTSLNFVPPTANNNGVSSLSAKTVMNWFRLRSLGKRDPEEPIFTPVERPGVAAAATSAAASGAQLHSGRYVGGASSSSTIGQPEPEPESTIQVIVTDPQNQSQAGQVPAPQPSSSVSIASSRTPPASHSRASALRTASETSRRTLVDTIVGRKNKYDATMTLRIHHGAVDQATVTNGVPSVVFAHVTKVLEDMGLTIQHDSEFKYRCIRPKKEKEKDKEKSGLGYATLALSGSAGSSGMDRRGLPAPSNISSTAGGMLRGLLMRRQSSQVPSPAVNIPASPTQTPTASSSTAPVSSSGAAASASTSNDTEADSSIVSEGPESVSTVLASGTTLYGDRSVDLGDEVRFSVELTRIDRLEDTLSLDIRRLKGNLRSYKFLYDTLRERCHFAQ